MCFRVINIVATKQVVVGSIGWICYDHGMNQCGFCFIFVMGIVDLFFVFFFAWSKFSLQLLIY